MSNVRRTRRSTILTAACLEFSEVGFAGARIESIARAAGIGKSTVYEYFPSKLDLFEGAANWMFDQLLEDVKSIMHSQLPLADKIREYLLYMHQILRKIGHGMLYMQGDKQDIVEIIQQRTTRLTDIMLGAITIAIEQGKESGELRQDADTAAIAQVICFMPSPILAHKIDSDDLDMDAIIHLLMHGMGA